MARTRVVGLDIGSSGVRAAEVQFGSGGPTSGSAEVVNFGFAPLPEGSVRDGEVAEPSTVASAINRTPEACRQLAARARRHVRDARPRFAVPPDEGSRIAKAFHDATISGASSPTGTVTFKLFDPSDATCSGTAAFSQTVTVNGNGTYSTSNTSFVVGALGTWRWLVTYSGDANNNSTTSACGVERFTLANG